MKKIISLCLLLVCIGGGRAEALSWAYPFVSWNGHVYKVTEEQVKETDLGEVIGEVERTADDQTGDYYGDASNFYKKGTKYYELKGIESHLVIAVEAKEGEWVKAVYIHKTPFHWTDLFTTWLPLLFLLSIPAVFIWKVKKMR